jgi:PAT family beta-lactamase induction signal transducer AmpG
MPSSFAASRWSVLVSGRLWLAALMGFFGGLPLLLTITILQAWLTREAVSLTTIGLFGLVGLPYATKFLWAPLLDRFQPLALGRRRGWLLLSQLGVIGSILLLGMQSPATAIWPVVIASYLLTFFSATQDIVIDAYRRESLADSEQGLAASFYTYGYRIGMLVAGSGGLIIAGTFGYRVVYVVMAAVMTLSLIVTLVAAEPAESTPRPRTLVDSFVGPFVEFFTRSGRFRVEALLLLIFIIAYKLGDNLGTHMATAFYLGVGFQEAEVGWARFLGTAALLAGVFVGGGLVLRLGIFWSLLVIGVLQGLSTACFAILTAVGPALDWLAVIISFEELSAGMGTTALIAFMAALTDKRFTATQFALLSALANAPRAFLVAPSGYFATVLGWPAFFVTCALVALPGLALLLYLRGWISQGAVPAGVPAAVAVETEVDG